MAETTGTLSSETGGTLSSETTGTLCPKYTNNNISVQYILSSFGETLNLTSKYLIAACIDSKVSSVKQILNDWFENGTAIKDDYFKNLALDMDNPFIDIEFQKHEDWKAKTQLRSTPTLLVNGYKLPEIYKVEDLCFFTNLDI